MRSIREPVRAERPGEPRLLISDYTDMEGEGDSCRIEPERDRPGAECPANQDDQDRHIHWVSRHAIQPDRDEMLWRRPRSKGASAGNVEVANAPEQQACADG